MKFIGIKMQGTTIKKMVLIDREDIYFTFLIVFLVPYKTKESNTCVHIFHKKSKSHLKILSTRRVT